MSMFYVIKLLRFRLILLIGLLYRPKNKIHFCCFFLLFFVLTSLLFLFNLVLLCSHHAQAHHTIIKQISVIFSVLLFDADCGTHKNTNRFIIWRRVCERTSEQRASALAHNLTHDGCLNWISRFLPTIWNGVLHQHHAAVLIFIQSLYLFHSHYFLLFIFGYKCLTVDKKKKKKKKERKKQNNDRNGNR